MTKILVVDDDDSINELIKINLELSGYDVISAFDGLQGFTLAKQELPDLIVLDVMMPDVDGYTVAKRVRENASTAEIPILMLTAMGQLEDKVKGFDLGVDDYLVKPVEMDDLKVRVRALVKRVNAIPESLATKEILTVGDITLLPETYSVKINDKTAKLTPIEFDNLNLLVQNHDCMVSSAKLLQDIWGYAPGDDVETIRVHIRHLRTNIKKVADGKEYIETIYGGCYRLLPEGKTSKN